MANHADAVNEFIRYIVVSNTRGCVKVLHANGYPSPRDPRELVTTVKKFIEEDGKDAIIELVSEHPDYDMIIDIAERRGDIVRKKMELPKTFAVQMPYAFDGSQQPTVTKDESKVTVVHLPNPQIRNFWVFAFLILITILIYKSNI